MYFINTTTSQPHAFEPAAIPSRYSVFSSGWEYGQCAYDIARRPIDGLPGPGLENLRTARLILQSRGIRWFWTAAGCINHLDAREVNNSIHCSAQLFKKSEVCFVYLYDLELDQEPSDGWETALRKCQWMYRAWSLHELIFSKRIEFYNRNWVLVGTKDSLLSSLSNITRVDQSVLVDPCRLADFSVGHKMSWIASCMVSRVEDYAYSMLGIFGVAIPVSYGEGQLAFLKLQVQIAKTTNDGTLFAWQGNGYQKYRGVFATSPFEFAFMSYSYKKPLRINGNIHVTQDGISISDRFDTYDGDGIVLTMWPDQDQNGGQGLGIILREQNGRHMRYMPHRTIDINQIPTSSAKELVIESGLPFGMETLTSQLSSRESHNRDGFIYTFQFPAPEAEQVYDFPENSDYSEGSQSKPKLQFPFDPEIKGLALRPYPGSHDGDDTEPVGTCMEDSNSTLDADNDLPTSNKSPSALIHRLKYDDVKCENRVNLETSNSSNDKEVPALITKIKEIGLKGFFSWVTEAQNLGKRCREETSPCYTTLGLRKRQKMEFSSQELSIEYATDSEDEETTIIQTHSLPKKFFACPLYAENEEGNISCLKTANLLTIDDVINHLLDVHRRPYYCPICGEIFPNCTQRDNHIIVRTCRQGPLPNTDGISEGQIRQVCYDFTSLQTKEVQWYMIWDTLFPGQKQPEQPYLCSDMEHTVCMMREFWTRKGFQIVSEHLDITEEGLPSGDRDLDQVCASVLTYMIEEVLDDIVQ